MNNTLYTDFILYIEGKETLFQSCSLQESMGSFPQLSVSLPPTKNFQELTANTIIQLFGPGDQEPILMFEGLLQQVTYQKTTSGRSASLTARAIPAYWQELYFYPKASIIPVLNQTATGGAPLIDSKIVVPSQANLHLMFTQIFESEDFAKGQISLPINRLLKEFAANDIFFSFLEFAYKTIDSVLILPNTVKEVQKLNFASTYNELLDVNTDLNSQHNLASAVNCLAFFMQSFYYDLTKLTSPTRIGNSQAFIRAVLKPTLTHTPPIKTNVWFPHEITTFSFNDQKALLTTRTVGHLDIGLLPVQRVAAPAVSRSYVAYPPESVQVMIPTSDGASTKQHEVFGFTPEEVYSGVRVQINPVSPFLEGNLDETINQENSTLEEKIRARHSAYTVHKTNKVRQAFLESRFATKTLSLSGTWNPNRILGLTSLIIDSLDESVYEGTLQSLTTQISGQGGVSQSASFTAVRYIDFNQYSGQLSNFITPEVDLEYRRDISEHLLDQRYYNYETIGQELYPILATGRLREKSQLENYLKNTKTEDRTPVEAELLLSTRLPEAANFSVYRQRPNLTSDQSYIESIKDLLRQYSQARESHEFSKAYTARNIMTRSAYFKAIGVKEATQPQALQNCANLNLLSDSEYFKAFFEKSRSAQPAENSGQFPDALELLKTAVRQVTIQREGQNTLANELGKPYNIVRRAYVEKAHRQLTNQVKQLKETGKPVKVIKQ